MLEFSLQCVILSIKLTFLSIVCCRCVGAFRKEFRKIVRSIGKNVIAIVKNCKACQFSTYSVTPNTQNNDL